jgi:hypothetical protein
MAPKLRSEVLDSLLIAYLQSNDPLPSPSASRVNMSLCDEVQSLERRINLQQQQIDRLLKIVKMPKVTKTEELVSADGVNWTMRRQLEMFQG